MELILLVKVAKLGGAGDIVNVKPGYARNFLLPKEKALRATAENKRLYQERKKELDALNAAKIAEAKEIFPLIDGKYVVIVRQAGEDGRLFGSVSSKDIAEQLSLEAKHSVNRSQIHLNSPIKYIGTFETEVELHPEVVAKIIVNVARSEAEAEEARKQSTKTAVKATSSEELESEALEE